MNADLRERPARASDYEAYARLFPELATGDPVASRASWEQEIAPHTHVVERAGEVVAYCYAPALEGEGHVRHLVVTPALRGQGVGLAMMRSAAARFQASGCARWFLNVKPDNLPALRLYQGLGMREELRSTALRLDWDRVPALAAPVIEGRVKRVEAGDDAGIERELQLPRGQIALLVAAGTRVLHWVEGPSGEALGFGAFDPQFPGAMPFRAKTPDQARPLIESFRAHALPGQRYIQLFVEGDPALTSALVSAGAAIRLEAVRLSAMLPTSAAQPP